jgi:alpha-1,2-mannosyltransferase
MSRLGLDSLRMSDFGVLRRVVAIPHGFTRLSEPARRAARHSLLIWPHIGIASMLLLAYREDVAGIDATRTYLPAGRAVLEGNSPYPALTAEGAVSRHTFAYPPLTAYLSAPLTLIPEEAVGLLASILAIALLFCALRAMGVRDWRCFSVVLLWLPTYSAVQTANVTVVVALGLALLWRFRDRPVPAAGLAGLLIALKLFLWPVLLWLVVTKRYRAAAGGVLASCLLIVGPWIPIRFAGLRDFPELLDRLARLQQPDGYTVTAILGSFTDWSSARAIALAVGFAVLAVALIVGRTDSRASFALVVPGSILLSPIVHMHYLVLLMIALALLVPRLDWRWVVPILLWVSPHVWGADTWQKIAVLLISGATVALATRALSARPEVASPALDIRGAPV